MTCLDSRFFLGRFLVDPSSPFGRMDPHTRMSSDFRRGDLREKRGKHLEHRRNKCKKGGEERIQVKKRSFSFVSFLFGKSDGGSIVLLSLWQPGRAALDPAK